MLFLEIVCSVKTWSWCYWRAVESVKTQGDLKVSYGFHHHRWVPGVEDMQRLLYKLQWSNLSLCPSMFLHAKSAEYFGIETSTLLVTWCTSLRKSGEEMTTLLNTQKANNTIDCRYRRFSLRDDDIYRN